MARFAHRRRLAILVLVLGMLVLVGAGLASAAFNTADPIPGQVRFVGIDTEITGNTFISVADYNDIRVVAPGDDFTIDVVVDEIDPSDGLLGAEANLYYESSSFTILSIDPNSMVFAAPDDPQSHTSYNDSLPESDGNFHFAFIDVGGAAESGEGVLARISVHCNSPSTGIFTVEDAYSPGSPPAIYSEAQRNDPNPQPLTIQNYPSSQVACGGTPTPPPTPICTPSPGDVDCDQVPNEFDNCPTVKNPGQEDGDGDGVGNVCDNCPNWANADQADTDGDGVGDAYDPDIDGDGSSNVLEAYVGTDPNQRCAATIAKNDEPVDASPFDNGDDRKVNGNDFLTYAPVYGHGVPSHPPLTTAERRYDVSMDNKINGNDFILFAPFYGKPACVP